ncbi:MAG: DUF4214 domain-containing protein [Burkholderiaceae bacterium]|nr:DUF4214 domain-containing protein [Burkholderiaceae bacterium]
MAYTAQIQALYVAYFNRPADVAGLNYWNGVLSSNGGDTSVVSTAFSQSAEYLSKYAGMTPQQVVNQVYLNLFGHAADTAGLQYWSNLLANGALHIADIVTDVSAGAQGTDLTVYQNQIAAATQFTLALQSGSTTQANGYSGAAANLAASQFLQSVVANPSGATGPALSTVLTGDLTNALSPASLQASVAAVDAAGSSATTYLLTTKADSLFASGTGPNVFHGVIDNYFGSPELTATLGAGDTIVGAGAFNTLSLTDSDPTGLDTIPALASINAIQNLTLKTVGNAGNGASYFDISSLPSITSVVVTSSGSGTDEVKAAATANIADTALGTGAGVTIGGGDNVVVSNGSGNVTVGGTTTSPVGAISVNTASSGTVSIDGGSSVSLNLVGPGSVVVDRHASTAGSIVVNDSGVTNTTTIAIGTATVAAGGTITVNESGAMTASGLMGGVTTHGGSTVAINETANVTVAEAATIAANSQAGSDVTVAQGNNLIVGGTATTSVTVNQTATATAAPAVAAVAATANSAAVPAQAGTLGVAEGSVTVNDANGFSSTAASTITSIALTNAANATINDSALASLSVAGDTGTVVLANYNTAAQTAAASTLNLAVNSLSGLTFTDASGEIGTLNVTTSGKTSVLNAINDTNLTTLNASGSAVLNLATVNTTLKTIAISGGAGFTGDVSALGSTLKSFTSSASGAITTTLDGTTQSFISTGSGRDIVTLTADADKVIKAGSASNNELILNAPAATFTAAGTGADVSGFTILGVSAASYGVYDLSVLTGFNSIDVQNVQTSASDSFIHVKTGSALSIDASSLTTGSVIYQTADSTGSTDSVSLTLGSGGKGITVGTSGGLTLEDANQVGIATINLNSNSTTTNAIGILTDHGLGTLNVSGTAGLSIGNLSESSSPSASFTLNNTSAGALSLAAFSDGNLGTLYLTGTGAEAIGVLNDDAASLAINNSNSAGATFVTVSDYAGSFALSITGAGSTTIGTLNDSGTGAAALTLNDSASTNVTVSEITIGTSVTATSETLTNTGSGTFTIVGESSAFTTVTVSGNVALGINNLNPIGLSAPAAIADTFTAGTLAPTATDATATYAMTALKAGQAYTIDGLTVVATSPMTAQQVADAFVAGVNGANYVVSGSYVTPADWVGVTASDSNKAILTLTSSATNASSDPGSANGGTSGVFTLTSTAGTTFSAGTDNAHISLSLAGAAKGNTDTITVGNGNNIIVDASTLGTVNVTVGGGSNLILLGSANANTTATFNVTLGAHTAAGGGDQISVGTAGDHYNSAPDLVVTGAAIGDIITLAADSASSAAALTATSLASATTVAQAVTALETALGTTGHTVVYGIYAGNTYIAETSVGIPVESDTSIVELVGVHTVTAAAGHIVVAS